MGKPFPRHGVTMCPERPLVSIDLSYDIDIWLELQLSYSQ